MRKRLSTIMAILVALSMVFIVGPVMAGDSDTQTVNYAVTAINEINIDDNSVTLTVNSATAGSPPDQASDSSTYDITTNVISPATKKITASIDSDMPSGLTLQIDVTAPSTGTGGGAKTLSTSAQDVVTAISAVNEVDISIGYTLDATIAAGEVSDSKTVTLTIADF
ncbi:MAG: hypothetical protein LWX51_03040 [Deltaproteobacteria bacterium]|jgi:beta-glucanase (GH16 family)|nr:hypothetical protein [Deltaproteobacteria bacterium]